MIGIFDSGSGGLSVLRALRAHLPFTDIIYFGDIKNAPYGEKSQKELSALTVHSIQFLQSRGAKNIVSACNSVSASLTLSLFDNLNFTSNQFIEMVEPTVSSFRDSNERVLLCATSATISSKIYQDSFHILEKDITTVVVPDLAGAIEFGTSEKEIEKIIVQAFANIRLETFDTLILGCTHYPLVMHIFTKVLGGSVRIVDPAQAVAKRAEEQFPISKIETGATHFFITKDSMIFRSRVEKFFLKSTTTVEVVEYL